ncbi:hypothetical protein [Rickettsiella endosymbiont of Xylota segnis]|uniref:hypothetical protein n=1 Tax=Rickettsiella endosymbiont of Xylota segnis TaxID=3066238 RepID=UPI0030CED6DE
MSISSVKTCIPSQQRYLAKPLGQGEEKIESESMNEELQLKKRPLFNEKVEKNNGIPCAYSRTRLFQAEIIIKHVPSQELQQAKDSLYVHASSEATRKYQRK